MVASEYRLDVAGSGALISWRSSLSGAMGTLSVRGNLSTEFTLNWPKRGSIVPKTMPGSTDREGSSNRHERSEAQDRMI